VDLRIGGVDGQSGLMFADGFIERACLLELRASLDVSLRPVVQLMNAAKQWIIQRRLGGYALG